MADTFFGGLKNEFERQEDVAFKLKLQSALVEQQKQSQMAMFDYQKASPEVNDLIMGMGGGSPDGKRRSVAELGLVEKGMVGLSNANARASGSSGGRGGATVADLEKSLGIDTGIPNKSQWMNPTQVGLWRSRLQSEKPTADVANQYKNTRVGLSLVRQIRNMRQEALKEVLSGPLAGRASNLAVAADQGKLFPKAKAYIDFVTANRPKLARASGEVGNMAEGDIKRSAKLAPTFEVADEAARIIFDSEEEVMHSALKTSEDLFPGLRRMLENEAGGQGIGSRAQALDPGRGTGQKHLDRDAVMRAIELNRIKLKQPKAN